MLPLFVYLMFFMNKLFQNLEKRRYLNRCKHEEKLIGIKLGKRCKRTEKIISFKRSFGIWIIFRIYSCYNRCNTKFPFIAL